MSCFAYDIIKPNFEGGIEYAQHKIRRQRDSWPWPSDELHTAAKQPQRGYPLQEVQTLASKAHAIIASVGIQMGLSTEDWITVRTMAAGRR